MSSLVWIGLGLIASFIAFLLVQYGEKEEHNRQKMRWCPNILEIALMAIVCLAGPVIFVIDIIIFIILVALIRPQSLKFLTKPICEWGKK